MAGFVPWGTLNSHQRRVLFSIAFHCYCKRLSRGSVSPWDGGAQRAALPNGKRKDMLSETLDGLVELFRGRILSFEVDAARKYAELAVKARTAGGGFPVPDGYIAAIAVSQGYQVASRDKAPFEAANVDVINPFEA